eukprot:scaffold4261_cov192-Skeletonema_marinoi.AAC.5
MTTEDETLTQSLKAPPQTYYSARLDAGSVVQPRPGREGLVEGPGSGIVEKAKSTGESLELYPPGGRGPRAPVTPSGSPQCKYIRACAVSLTFSRTVGGGPSYQPSTNSLELPPFPQCIIDQDYIKHQQYEHQQLIYWHIENNPLDNGGEVVAIVDQKEEVIIQAMMPLETTMMATMEMMTTQIMTGTSTIYDPPTPNNNSSPPPLPHSTPKSPSPTQPSP